MAASLTKCGALLQGVVGKIRCGAQTCANYRLYATSCKQPDAERHVRIAEAPDKSCILCWHPEPEFPYENTQPIPRTEESREGESPLKVNLLLEEKLKMRPDGPTDHELCNIFFTTKHQWRPRTQLKYRKPQQPLDREGL